jgi:hypothetical protein
MNGRKFLGGYIYIYIYDGLNESSFYHVGTCLEAESFHEDWILDISVGSENYKLGILSESWISHI